MGKPKVFPDHTFGHFDYFTEIRELTEICGSQNGFARDAMRAPDAKSFWIR